MKNARRNIFFPMILLPQLWLGTSCLSNSAQSSKERTSLPAIANTPESVSVGHGRILADNPIILSQDRSLSANVNLNEILTDYQVPISTTQFLEGGCGLSHTCYTVKNDEFSTPMQNIENRWAYDANSPEFLQVHTFGHMRIQIEKYVSDLKKAHGHARLNHSSTTSFDNNIITNQRYWPAASTLKAYSNCDQANNASFSPANFDICLGYLEGISSLKLAQDPTVIYHEMGHAFNQNLLNLNNRENSSVLIRADLGYHSYDEAGALGEGISDFWSYYVNKRAFLGEWALDRFIQAARPMREDHPIHAPGISTAYGERLIYPAHLTYDVNNHTQNVEEIHSGGMIISHYLTALTEDLISTCSLSHDAALSYLFYFLSETFNDLGNFEGTKGTNLDLTHAQEWLKTARPINYRSFSQTFARYINNILGDNSSKIECNGGEYPKDRIEQLLDSYGLLLFKTYNSDRNSQLDATLPLGEDGHDVANAAANGFNKVGPLNRSFTNLIAKEHLIYDPEVGISKYFIFDKADQLREVIRSFTQQGVLTTSSVNFDTSLPFNNANGKISPGEFVGIMPNLYNNSNSVMGGVTFISNDWDHFDGDEPCNTFEDQFPSIDQGGTDAAGCNSTTASNGDDGDLVKPACFVQVKEVLADESVRLKWASQKELATKMGMLENKCLNGNYSDCFIKSPKGADIAHFSKINPKTTWTKTITKDNGDPSISSHNLIYFEVNKLTPPGTTFNCRMRATFTNCNECNHDSGNNDDDFLDHEYSGDKPFKIFNYQFTITD